MTKLLMNCTKNQTLQTSDELAGQYYKFNYLEQPREILELKRFQ